MHVESFPWLMGEGVQLVMLGSGREDLENELRNMENQRKDQCRCGSLCLVPILDVLSRFDRYDPMSSTIRITITAYVLFS